MASFAAGVLTRRAWAKVNLALSVGPPQPPGSPKPGWHPICTWMHAIDLADDLTVETAAETRYELAWAADAPRPSAIDWPNERDLAVRAHRLLESHAGRALPIHLRLAKRIPVGGGLGGGSADAAAVLQAVNALYQLGLLTGTLRTLSQSLGSDVAFFIDQVPADTAPRPAIVSGFGDRVERLPARRADALLLILPAFGCATPGVYSAYDAAPHPLRGPEVRALAAAPGPPTGLFNDLETPAAAVAPALAPLRAAVSAAIGRPLHMTGSGSTLFAITTSRDEARALATRASAIPGITAIPSRLV